jgi:cytochrome c
MKLIQSILLVSVSTLLFSSLAIADEGADLYTAKTCSTCHGADAKTPIMSTYPKIAGQNKDYIIQQMTDIKSGARSNGQSIAMKSIMAQVSDEDIAKIAAYVAGLE